MKKKKRRLKKKRVIILLIALIIILGLIIFGYFHFFKSDMLNLKDNLTAEINSSTYATDFIDSVKNDGKIVSKDYLINTSKLGYVMVTVKASNRLKKNKIIKFRVKVVDTNPPEISGEKDIYLLKGSDFDIKNCFSVTDNSKENVSLDLSGDYNLNADGVYEVILKSSDSSKNEATKKVNINVVSSVEEGHIYYTSKGFRMEVKDGVTYIDDNLIVNKTYALPSNYSPKDPASRNMNIEKNVSSEFDKMASDAAALGLNIYISSGYRPYSSQQIIYNNYVSKDGVVAADTYSARAGHSEHQTGLCYDLNSVDSSFAYTNEGKWIKDNCYLYGFIIRYPEGKDSITGYMYEPWHLRYVGVELATKLYNNGSWITLEEYYGIDSSY